MNISSGILPQSARVLKWNQSFLTYIILLSTTYIAYNTHSPITYADGLRVQIPYLNLYFSVPNSPYSNYSNYNFSRLLYDPTELQFLDQRLTYSQFSHALASYAPSLNLGTGSRAAGPMIVLEPQAFAGIPDEFLCNPLPPTLSLKPEYRTGNSSYIIQPDSRWPDLNTTVNVAGSILLTSRGNCSFQMKSYYAQEAGAYGLIVTNPWAAAYPPTNDDLLVMNSDPSFEPWLRDRGVLGPNDHYEFMIPSIFVTQFAFENLYFYWKSNLWNQINFEQLGEQFLWNFQQQLNQTSTTNSSTNTGTSSARRLLQSSSSSSSSTGADSTLSNASSSSTGSSGPSITFPLTPVFRYIQVYVSIDSDSQSTTVDTTGSYDSFRIAAYFLLVLPTLWFLVAVTYMFRRCGIRYRERSRKLMRKQLIPIVKYHILTPSEREKLKRESSPTSPLQIVVAAASTSSTKQVGASSSPLTHSHHPHHDSASVVVECKEDVELQPIVPAGSTTLHPLAAPISFDPNARMSTAAAAVLDDEDEEETTALSSTNAKVNPSIDSPRNDSDTLGVGIDSKGKSHRIVGNACAICLSDFEENETLSILPCAHAFHSGSEQDCITPWLDKSNECPTCRRECTQPMDDLDNSNSNRCADYCFPLTTRAQRDTLARRRAAAERRRQAAAILAAVQARAGADGQYQEVVGGQVPRPSNPPRPPPRASSALHRDYERGTNQEQELQTLPTVNPSTSTSSSTAPTVLVHLPSTGPAAAASSASSASSTSGTADLYSCSSVSSAINQFTTLIGRYSGHGPASQESEVKSALVELKLTCDEYCRTPASLTDEQASLLLTQMQAEIELIVHHFFDLPDVIEASITCASVLQFVHENIERKMKRVTTR